MNLFDMLSMNSLQDSLESVNWTLHDENGEAHEFWKIPKEEKVLSIILNTLPYSIGQLGDYNYTKENSIIKRKSHLIKAKSFKNSKFIVEELTSEILQ
jgi:hypothetical protein